jgi:hypothetical protein
VTSAENRAFRHSRRDRLGTGRLRRAIRYRLDWHPTVGAACITPGRSPALFGFPNKATPAMFVIKPVNRQNLPFFRFPCSGNRNTMREICWRSSLRYPPIETQTPRVLMTGMPWIELVSIVLPVFIGLGMVVLKKIMLRRKIIEPPKALAFALPPTLNAMSNPIQAHAGSVRYPLRLRPHRWRCGT